MKKLFAMLMTAVLAISAAGCGGSEPAADNGLEDFSIVLDW